MAESLLYLVRHGQTEANAEERLGLDTGLTDKGIKHAEKAAEWLKEVKFDKMYCTPLERSKRTAQIIHQYHDSIPLIRVPELVEISPGDMNGMSYTEFEREHPELFEARKKDKYNWAFPNGESYETAAKRARPFLDELRSSEGIFAFVGHQGINRVVLGYLLDLPKDESPFLVMPNDVIFVIDMKNPQSVYHIKDREEVQGYKVTK